ncbi:hypothetical protein VNO77_02408 [Canavalia gladiata]|uniref:Uncharacterized protein n=1 Tax=Canavalia gladiata TaxID=3824 RepID=A0AAN9MSY2_CANGL
MVYLRPEIIQKFIIIWSNMVDKAAYVVSLLVSVSEAKGALVDEGEIPVLVEIAEVGSQRQKEIGTSFLANIVRTAFSLGGPAIVLNPTLYTVDKGQLAYSSIISAVSWTRPWAEALTSSSPGSKNPTSSTSARAPTLFPP